MKRQHPPWFTLSIVFVLTLLAIATGPVGFVVMVMIGVPVLILVAMEVMVHSGRSGQR